MKQKPKEFKMTQAHAWLWILYCLIALVMAVFMPHNKAHGQEVLSIEQQQSLLQQDTTGRVSKVTKHFSVGQNEVLSYYIVHNNGDTEATCIEDGRMFKLAPGMALVNKAQYGEFGQLTGKPMSIDIYGSNLYSIKQPEISYALNMQPDPGRPLQGNNIQYSINNSWKKFGKLTFLADISRR